MTLMWLLFFSGLVDYNGSTHPEADLASNFGIGNSELFISEKESWELATNDEDDHIDPAYLHEAHDRAYIASCHLQMALNDHPVIIGHTDLQELFNLAVEKIEDLDQAIGQKLPE